jgi:glucose/arabinose dehydrogenase
MKILLATALSITTTFALVVGQQKTTDVTVTGHEPAKIPATDQRINSLKVPNGFHVQKFAEIENPRMLTVGPDGTIYVSQREPGTVSMLKDTDMDGVADIQQVVAEKPKLHGLAIHNGKMYLATVTEVYVADIQPDGSLGGKYSSGCEDFAGVIGGHREIGRVGKCDARRQLHG